MPGTHTTFYVIANPTAGKGRAAHYLPALQQQLTAHKLPFELVCTTAASDAEYLARAAAQQDYRAVIVAGGDGTINEVVNALVHTAMPLGIVPLGTGNDVAKMVKLKAYDVPGAVARLQAAQPRPVDVGMVGDRAFLNGLGVGFDAAVAFAAREPSRLTGVAVYLKALVKVLLTFRAPRIEIEVNGRTEQRQMLMVCVGNGRCQGGGFWLTPEARIDDGLLDLCLVDNLSKLRILTLVGRVMRGKHTTHRKVTMARTTAFTLRSPDPLPVHIDGEVWGTEEHQLEVKLLPGALQLLA